MKMSTKVQLTLTVANAALSQSLVKTLAQCDVILILCTVQELFHLHLTRSIAASLTTCWIIWLLLCVVLWGRCLIMTSTHSSCNCCSHRVTLHNTYLDTAHTTTSAHEQNCRKIRTGAWFSKVRKMILRLSKFLVTFDIWYTGWPGSYLDQIRRSAS